MESSSDRGEAMPDTNVAAFESDGFVAVPRLVGARTLASLRAATDALLRDGAHLERDTVLRGAQYEVQSVTGRSSDGAVAPGVLRKVTFPHKSHAPFARLRHDPRVLAVLHRLGLARPRCVVDQVNVKAPRVGTGFPWHQDAYFVAPHWQGRIERHGGANVILALDPCDETNGAFEVLARTHLAGPRSFGYDTGAMTGGVFDESGRTLLRMAPGDAVFFHPYLAHGSQPNTSDRPRRVVALWFVDDGPAPAP